MKADMVVRCPKCRSGNVTTFEMMSAYILREFRDGVLSHSGWNHDIPTGKGHARCDNCDHYWNLRAETLERIVSAEEDAEPITVRKGGPR